MEDDGNVRITIEKDHRLVDSFMGNQYSFEIDKTPIKDIPGNPGDLLRLSIYGKFFKYLIRVVDNFGNLRWVDVTEYSIFNPRTQLEMGHVLTNEFFDVYKSKTRGYIVIKFYNGDWGFHEYKLYEMKEAYLAEFVF